MATTASAASAAAPGWDLSNSPFPSAKRGDHVDTYKSKANGDVKVADPYRWLELPPSQSKDTKQWVDAQAAFAQEYITGYTHRDLIKKRLEETFSYPRFSCPSLKYDGNFYYSYNSGLEPQSRIFKATPKEIQAVQSDSGDNAPPGKVFFDANRLSKDGAVALTVLAFSHTGKSLAYGISKAGSDWFSLYFRSTDKPFDPPASLQDVPDADKGGKDRFPDELHHVKFSGATWTHDDKGIFYQRFPAPGEVSDLGSETDPNVDAKLYYHRIGTTQDQDTLVIDVDPQVRTGMFSPEVTDDGKWLIVGNGRDTDPKTRRYLASLEGHDFASKEPLKWICLADKFEDDFDYLANDGNTFYFMTNRNAPRYRILKATFDPANLKAEANPWKLAVDPSVALEELIPEDAEGGLLSSATIVDHDKLLLVYSRNVVDELWQYDLKSGKKVARLLPNLVGSIAQISGKREDATSYVSSSSFVSPGTITKFQWSGGKSGEEPKVSTYRTTAVTGLDPNDYVTSQEWFTSVDGTKVPMFLTHHKDTKRDGTAPAWVYGYGGFNIALNPTFSASLMSWVKTYGGVLAWPNIRGGGEFGEDWHNAGRRFNKHHTFEDFLSAAKYLHENKIAAKGKITLNGGSNGGLTVMSSLNMATDAHGVGAGVAEVGVLDMLKFQQWTIGRAWVPDFGCSENPEDFDYLIKISPLHNVDENKAYPATFLLTADHDDRVSPAHSFKMAAELQHKLSKNPNPVLLRVDIDAGHGAGKSTQRRIEEAADKYAAVARALDLPIKQ